MIISDLTQHDEWKEGHCGGHQIQTILKVVKKLYPRMPWAQSRGNYQVVLLWDAFNMLN